MSDEKDEVIEGELVPYTKAGDISKFLEQPMPSIAEAITGALTSDKSELLGSLGRIAQGAIKGKGREQFGKEFEELRQRGAIKEDITETKYGFQSFAELLRFIDDECPDPERMRAVKTMFFSLISVDTAPGDEALSYKLFLLSKKLTATQLAIMAAIYKLYMSKPGHQHEGGADLWLSDVAKAMGHGIKALVESEEKTLEDCVLITARRHSDRSGINERNHRLTDLGIKFCEHLTNFETDIT